MKATLLVITDGRKDCLQQSVPAFDLCIDPNLIERRVVVDDSTDPYYGEWIDETFEFDERISSQRRRGFDGAIRAGWQAVADADYVFHLEDDFVLARHVPLRSMMEVLDSQPNLAQMALRRQPWGPEEVMAGGYIARNPEAFVDCWDLERPERRWLEHRAFFTTNPSVYPAWIVKRGWPQAPRSEGIFSIDLFRDNPQAVCGIWGHRNDPPWAIHVGHYRAGIGY